MTAIFIGQLKNFYKLIRFALAVAIASSSAATYLIFKHSFDANCLYVFLGVLIFSSLASLVNSYQEKNLDELMERTKFRAHALQQIKKKEFVTFALSLFLAGAYFLIKTGNVLPLVLAIINLIWYNVVYTPLKKKTAYALILGAFTGAIPPVIGWTAAGGSIFDTQIIVISSFMFLWQIPHFWLLLIRNAIDYQRAGFKLTVILHKDNIRLVIFYWILSTILCSSVFPAFNIVNNKAIIISMLAVNICMLIFFYRKLFSKLLMNNDKGYLFPFYLYQAFILIILIIDSLGTKQLINM